MHRSILVPLALCGALLVIGAGASSAARSGSKVSINPVARYTNADLDAFAGNNWLSVGGDLKSTRYSTLTQINKGNVANLKEAWHIHGGTCPAAAIVPVVAANISGCSGQEQNAVVADGVMYLSDTSDNVYALDATNGQELWRYTPTPQYDFRSGAVRAASTVTGGRMPGVNIGNGSVFLGQRDGRIVALNNVDGSMRWQSTIGPWYKGVTLSETPIYFEGSVIEGTSGGDGGSQSAIMSAYNATSGALQWSWNIIPSHNQPGGNTWPWSGTHSDYGGGAMWEQPEVDAKNHQVIFGTGNTVPWNSRGPGANLWTDSIVALDTRTGFFNWGYQTTRHDLWDSDLPNGSIVADVKQLGGKTVREVLAQTKQGWGYALNAKTGKPEIPIIDVKVPTLPNSPDVNAWPTQPVPQTPNVLPGCFPETITPKTAPLNGSAIYPYNLACYDQPTPGQHGRLGTNPVRWTGFVAPNGKPITLGTYYDPYDTTGYVTQPFESMDWPNNSYSPLTNSFISCGVTNRTYGKSQTPAVSQVVSSNGGIGSGISSISDSSIDPFNLNDFGNFAAWDMGTTDATHGGKFMWHQTWETPCYSGSMNTASGLTFVGHIGKGNGKDGLGYLAAVDSKTGAELWESGLMDAPATSGAVTYSVYGTQYVTIVSGGEGHNDPTRPSATTASQRVRGDSIYTYKLG